MKDERYGKTENDMAAEKPTDPAGLPRELSILPLRNTVVYPYSVVPLVVASPRSVKLVEDALKGDRIVGLVGIKDESIEEARPGQIFETGTLAKVERMIHTEGEEHLHIIVQGLSRFRIEYWLTEDPYLRAQAAAAPELKEEDLETDALVRSLRHLAEEILSMLPNFPKEAKFFLDQVQDPRNLVYLVASTLNLAVDKGQALLEAETVKEKLRFLVAHLSKEKEILTLGKKIRTDAKGEMDKAQREYYLRQQIKAIRKELGEAEQAGSETDEYREKLDGAGLPDEVKKEADREYRRLKGMHPQAPEHFVIKTYLDWLLSLPWKTATEDLMDVELARTVLDEDHYDLQEVKERIIEYLAVRKLSGERGIRQTEADPGGSAMGAILCFVGPPGVGKTSLGQSIARALGRKFTRMSLGGMRDEAEIRGHRRTYIGAMPGRIIQAIKRAGTRNPVFMLDEIDKVGSDWRGDPSSALLEVLDPAQNHAFRDHYLDVDFDLSEVFFITTANQLETIPAPLRDRMEIIHLDGYTEYEKIHIAKKYLVPRQLRANGLHEDEIELTEEALRKIIQDYTREAGVRSLERQIGAICRKSVVRIAGRGAVNPVVTPETVRKYLKKELFDSQAKEPIDIPGIATGLAVTAAGGDILYVEATRMKGNGKLTLTGQLGEVMRESAQIAHSYVRSKAAELGVDPEELESTDVHLHVPAGAVPKDGPSAGVVMVTAIASLFSKKPVRSDLGMTGEVTLRGRVLPVGGIKMKILAAHRAGLSTVILPGRNDRDLEDLPEDVRRDLRFVLVDRIDQAFSEAFEQSPEQLPTAVNA